MVKKKRTCKQKGYHNWEVTGVTIKGGEEVELSCEDCGAYAIAEVNYVGDL